MTDHLPEAPTVTATFFEEQSSVLGPGSGPIVVCDKVWNSGNIGQIVRLAHNMDCKKLYLVKDPHHVNSRRKIIARAAQGRVFWERGRAQFVESTAELEALLPRRELRHVIGIETAPGAQSLLDPRNLLITPQKHAITQREGSCDERVITPCLVFGSENKGISEELLELCDMCLFVPCPGPMKSINVSQCVALVLFEWLRQNRHAQHGATVSVAAQLAATDDTCESAAWARAAAIAVAALIVLSVRR